MVVSMITLQFTKQQFPAGENGSKALIFGEKALVRAAIAAGSNWRIRKKSAPEQFDIDMRVNCVRSMLYTTSGSLKATCEHKLLGSTRKGNKSFHLGNT